MTDFEVASGLARHLKHEPPSLALTFSFMQLYNVNSDNKGESITGMMFDKFPRSERTYVVMVTTKRYGELCAFQ